jgi:hypothetical protein
LGRLIVQAVQIVQTVEHMDRVEVKPTKPYGVQK